MRLDPRFRALLYAVACVLVVSGAGWLIVDRLKSSDLAEGWRTAGAYLLMVHGGAAMLMLVLLGALVPLHAAVGWRRRRNRTSGLVMLAVNAILVVTAFGLYYTGAETVRTQASAGHSALGLGLPVLWLAHVWLGRRRSPRLRPERRATAGSGRAGRTAPASGRGPGAATPPG